MSPSTIAPGEVHALVGKNGAGKSTLMHVLTGLYAPDSGEIRIRGKSYDRLNRSGQAAGIAIVSQHAKYVPGLSIAENIILWRVADALRLRRLGAHVSRGR